jgi:hypothetical protein
MEATAGHPRRRRRGGGGEEDDRVSSLEDVGVAVPPPRHEGGARDGLAASRSRAVESGSCGRRWLSRPQAPAWRVSSFDTADK